MQQSGKRAPFGGKGGSRALNAATGEEESFAAFCPPYDKIVSENGRETFRYESHWLGNNL